MGVIADTTFCLSLAGEELGRIPSWGPTPAARDYECEPVSMLDAPQTITEPILVKARKSAGQVVSSEYQLHPGRRRRRHPGQGPADRGSTRSGRST